MLRSIIQASVWKAISSVDSLRFGCPSGPAAPDLFASLSEILERGYLHFVSIRVRSIDQLFFARRSGAGARSNEFAAALAQAGAVVGVEEGLAGGSIEDPAIDGEDNITSGEKNISDGEYIITGGASFITGGADILFFGFSFITYGDLLLLYGDDILTYGANRITDGEDKVIEGEGKRCR